MIKPHNPEIGVWKESVWQKPAKRGKIHIGYVD
jgi:hypothetical protein